MKEKENNKERILNWFHNSDKADESFVRNFFCDDDKKDQLRSILSSQFYEIMKSRDDSTEKELDHILYRIHYDINSAGIKKGNRFPGWALRAAAIIILPVLVFWGIKGYMNYNDANDAIAEIHSPAWTRTSFVLPDGTTGWLNSGSTIKYRMDFNNDRQLELSGEGYFDVVADKGRPFRVIAGDITVKVHGTKFNVASWDNDREIEVVLEEGKVELSDKDTGKPLMLDPGQLALFDKSKKKFMTERVETKKYLSWTEGKLVFRNDPMETVEKRLERWYDVDVEVMGSFSEDFRLRATFVDESLEDVLNILKKSIGIEYSIKESGINSDDSYEKKKVTIRINGK